jgi:hypothetical protein
LFVLAVGLVSLVGASVVALVPAAPAGRSSWAGLKSLLSYIFIMVNSAPNNGIRRMHMHVCMSYGYLPY